MKLIDFGSIYIIKVTCTILLQLEQASFEQKFHILYINKCLLSYSNEYFVLEDM